METAITNLARYIAPGLFLIGLLILTFRVLEHFIIPVGWAIILAYVTWPLHRLVQRACGGKDTPAALLTTLLLTSVIVIPLVWASFLLQIEIVEIYHNLPRWLDKKPALPDFAVNIPYMGRELERLFEQADTLRELLRDRVLPWAQQYSGQFLNLLGDVGYNAAKLGFTLLTVFFFYREGPEVIGQVRKVLWTLLGDRSDGYITTTEEMVKAVVYGIVLTAIAQGTLAGLGYWAVGLRAPILLGLVTMFFSMIPFGTPLVWVSASLWLLANDQHWAGISLALWGSLVVSWVDNIIRPLVISGATRIPFLLVFFGVIGGLANFGFIGLFFGPVVLAISFAVWREWLEHQILPEEDSKL
ncbi:MAG: AI-2E family transporter [Methylococcaceae bacterium]|nr:AI-2E family transporter [Methylococcaceae bacterium]